MTTILFNTNELVNERESHVLNTKELTNKANIAPLAWKAELLELKVDIVKWVNALMMAHLAVMPALVKLL
jgi:hypothetical protein